MLRFSKSRRLSIVSLLNQLPKKIDVWREQSSQVERWCTNECDESLLKGKFKIDEEGKELTRLVITRVEATMPKRTEIRDVFSFWSTVQCHPTFLTFVLQHEPRIQKLYDDEADPNITETGRLRLEAMAMMPRETPKALFLRVALFIYLDDWNSVTELFQGLCRLKFNLSTAVYRNAGTWKNQLASCFVVTPDDTVESLRDMMYNMTNIFRPGSAVGVGMNNIRAAGTPVVSQGTKASGPLCYVEMLSLQTRTIMSRDGKFSDVAVYFDIWHADFMRFLDGTSQFGARPIDYIFFGVMIPDEFMKRVKERKMWYFFSPDVARELTTTYGEEFSEAYEKCVASGKFLSCEPALQVYLNLCNAICKTGKIYVVFKCPTNRYSNQRRMGMIHNLNLCAEIAQVTDGDTIAVCTLGTMSLPRFVDGQFDYEQYLKWVRILTRAVDRMVDRQTYPCIEAENGAKMRAIGIGSSGLQDVFFELGLPYDSPEARALNHRIYEATMLGTLQASCKLAQEHGPHFNYHKSELARGNFTFELWPDHPPLFFSTQWEELRREIAKYGVRNSLTTTQMPTAGSSIITNVYESFEPQQANVYTIENLNGRTTSYNKLLTRHYGGKIPNNIITAINANYGSIAKIPELSALHNLCKTVYEVDRFAMIQMSADRQRFIDQSQSFNMFYNKETAEEELPAGLFVSWQRGLKTGCYYTRFKSLDNPTEFGTCRRNDPACDACTV